MPVTKKQYKRMFHFGQSTDLSTIVKSSRQPARRWQVYFHPQRGALSAEDNGSREFREISIGAHDFGEGRYSA